MRLSVENNDLERLRGELESLPDRVSVTITAEDNATATLQGVRGEATSVGELRPTVTVDAENNTNAAFSEVRGGSAEIGALNPTVTVGAENNASSTFSEVTGEAATVGGLNPTVTVNARNNATSEFAAVTAESVAVGSLDPTIKIDVDGAATATAELAATGAAAAASGESSGVASKAFSAFGSIIVDMIPGLSRAAGGFTSMGSTIGTLAALGVGAVVFLTALATVLAVVVAAIGPLVAILAIATAGIAALAAGVALVAAPFLIWAKNASTAAQANKDAETQAKAVQAASQGLKTAQDQLAQANQRVGTATQQAAQQNRDAYRQYQEAVRSAQGAEQELQRARETLARATTENRRAQEDLNRAMRDEPDRVARQELDLSDARIKVRENTLHLQEAQQKLNEARASGNIQDVKRAEIDLDKAYNDQSRGVLDLHDAQNKLNDTRQSGTKELQSAQQAAVRAGQAQTQAAQDVQKQQDNLRVAYEKVGDSITHMATVAREGQQHIAQAQDDARRAADRQTEAMDKLTEATNKQKIETDLATRLWKQYGPTITAAFQPAIQQAKFFAGQLGNIGEGILPALGKASALTLAGVRQGFMGAISTISPTESGSFGQILAALGPLFQNLTSAASDFIIGFGGFVDEALPDITSFSALAKDIAAQFRAWVDSEGGRDKIREFLSSAWPVAQALWQALVKIVPPLFDMGVKYGPTVVTIINNLATAITDYVLPALGWLLTYLGWAYPKFIALVNTVGYVKNQVVAIFGVLAGLLKPILDTIYDVMVQPFVDVYNDVLGENGWIPSLVAKVKEWLGGDEGSGGLMGWLTGPSYGQKLATAITKPFSDADSSIVSNSIVPEMVNDIEAWFTGLPEKIGAALQYLTDWVKKPFVDAWDSIVAEVSTWGDRIKTYGSSVIIGFWNGLVETWKTDILPKLQGLWESVKTGMKTAFGIKSPSTEGYYAGAMLGRGLELGILDRVNPTRLAAQELARAAIEPLSRLDTASLTLGTEIDGTPGAVLWRGAETVPTLPAPVAPNVPGTSGGDAGAALAIVAEIRALRTDNQSYAARHEELMALLADSMDEMSPRLRREILDMAKNDKAFRQSNIAGQQSELEKKLFTGV